MHSSYHNSEQNGSISSRASDVTTVHPQWLFNCNISATGHKHLTFLLSPPSGTNVKVKANLMSRLQYLKAFSPPCLCCFQQLQALRRADPPPRESHKMFINKRWKPAKRDCCGWIDSKTTGLKDTVRIKSLFHPTIIIYVLKLRVKNVNALCTNSLQKMIQPDLTGIPHIDASFAEYRYICCLLATAYEKRGQTTPHPHPPKHLMRNWKFFKRIFEKPFKGNALTQLHPPSGQIKLLTNHNYLLQYVTSFWPK